MGWGEVPGSTFPHRYSHLGILYPPPSSLASTPIVAELSEPSSHPAEALITVGLVMKLRVSCPSSCNFTLIALRFLGSLYTFIYYLQAREAGLLCQNLPPGP